jgi:hypothetical protein
MFIFGKDVRLLTLLLGTLHYGSNCNLPHAFDYGFFMIRLIFKYTTLWVKLQFASKIGNNATHIKSNGILVYCLCSLGSCHLHSWSSLHKLLYEGPKGELNVLGLKLVI